MQMSEPFEFEVQYNTTFEQIEKLRERMLEFIRGENRDFLLDFFIAIKGTISFVSVADEQQLTPSHLDIPEQDKLVLATDIQYKSNWQHGALKG